MPVCHQCRPYGTGRRLARHCVASGPSRTQQADNFAGAGNRKAINTDVFSSGLTCEQLSKSFVSFGLCRTLQFSTTLSQYTLRSDGNPWIPPKTATLTFCIEPGLKEAARTAAVNERQSIANMIAVMIRDYCGRVCVEIAEQSPPVGSKPAATINQKNRIRSLCCCHHVPSTLSLEK